MIFGWNPRSGRRLSSRWNLNISPWTNSSPISNSQSMRNALLLSDCHVLRHFAANFPQNISPGRIFTLNNCIIEKKYDFFLKFHLQRIPKLVEYSRSKINRPITHFNRPITWVIELALVEMLVREFTLVEMIVRR